MFFIFFQVVSAFKIPQPFNFTLPVSEVKNERNCNASYIFASTSALESAYAQNISNNTVINFSDQFILSVLEANCTGDTLETALEVLKINGTTNESIYPYYGQGIYIPSSNLTKVTIKNYNVLSMNKKNFTDMLAKKTLIVRFKIDNIDNLVNYIGDGVYKCESLGDDTHYMLAVEHDELKDAVYLKNNWGLGWGNAGYLLLSLNDTSEAGPCGIYESVTWIDL
jgi:C1A family cysteine protease